ncbi:hypothetical protein PACTADRAFT_50933 [Pachysolen tannophilus NRRL Y-2460]|uniref:Probable NADPH dehydrogenase n=1 Tax=Pachysolen tannophilus NRRL Y-2460 TaxID=669874 RepID=A0A1E4TQT7_PACTA|nr:hypothetical protein PACTADRAFT_50933 [Pachysolen tannophilus NRRL Y-2460]
MSLQKTKYSLENTSLFKPIKVGKKELENRVCYAPTTRMRATIDGVPSDLMLQYYDERSRKNGGLIVVEATLISREASGYAHAPGIYNSTQAKAWKQITDKIHSNGTTVCCQLMNLGRAAIPDELKRLGVPFVGPSAIYSDDESKEMAKKAGIELRALTLDEIEKFKQQYLEAARYAINEANFDLVEVHGAHGYFLDQFLQPASNKRTDKYGGSIENRSRLLLEVMDLLIQEFGADKVAVRLSPWAQFNGMKGDEEVIHPISYIGYVLSELQHRATKGQQLAYISVVEPRVSGIYDVDQAKLKNYRQLKSNEWIYQIWRGNVMRAGNYLSDRDNNYAILREDVEAHNDRTLIAFGRYYTSNPDFVERLRNGWDFTHYDRPNFYSQLNYHYNNWAKFGEANTSTVEDAESKRLPVALV